MDDPISFPKLMVLLQNWAKHVTWLGIADSNKLRFPGVSFPENRRVAAMQFKAKLTKMEALSMVGSPADGDPSVTTSMPPGNSENWPYQVVLLDFGDLNKGLIGELQTEKYRGITGNNLGHAKVFYPDMLECWTQNHGTRKKLWCPNNDAFFWCTSFWQVVMCFFSYNCPVILGHEHRIRPISSFIILQIVYVHICISDSWFLLPHKTSPKTRRLRRFQKSKPLIVFAKNVFTSGRGNQKKTSSWPANLPQCKVPPPEIRV